MRASRPICSTNRVGTRSITTLLLCAAVGLSLGLGCAGSGSDSGPAAAGATNAGPGLTAEAIVAPVPAKVAVSPATASLAGGAAQTFSATVNGSSTTDVAWVVDGMPGGNSTVGTVVAQSSQQVGLRQSYYTPASNVQTISVQAGDLVVVGWANSASPVTTSCSDSSGNTYKSLPGPAFSLGVNCSGYGFYTIAKAANSSLKVTIASRTLSSLGIWVQVVKGISPDLSTVLDGAAYRVDTANSTAHTSAAITTSNPSDYLFTFWMQDNNGTTLAENGTGFYLQTQNVGGSCTAAKVVTTAGSVAEKTTSTKSVMMGSIIAAFKAASPAGCASTAVYTAPAAGGTHTIGAVNGAAIGTGTVTVTASTTTSSSGSTSSPAPAPAPVSVTMSPTSASLGTGGTASLSASVANTTTTGVTWAVDGVAGGNSSVGTISGSGNTVTYTAPGTSGSHTVVATSVADTTAKASAAISVTAPAINVAVGAASATVAAGGTDAVTATVTGTTNTAVTWKVDGVAGGNSTVGTLSGTGTTVNYLAPVAAGTHTITATSSADTTRSASTSITVQAPVVTVTLNPSGSASVSTSGTLAFSASVAGTTNTAVTWSVDGIANGNSTVGTLSGTGSSVVYTAPAATGTHQVTATSAQNTSVSASTTVAVQSASSVAVALTQVGPASLEYNGATLLTASVTGSTNTAVTWSVDGIANGNATVGTIARPLAGNQVIYNAPATSGSHVITAVSAADTSRTASITMNVAATTVPVASITVGANVKDSPYSATGNGVTDDTAAIMAAVRAVAGTGKAVVIPAGTYMINATANSGAGIVLGSNMTLYLQPGAVLQALPTSTQHYQVVAAIGVKNVNIVGGTIRGNNGNNTIATPTTVEDGNAIKISGSSNIVVEGVTTANCFCDGIYIAAQSSNITVANSTCTSNRRNGMSIVYGTNMAVRNSTFSANTGSVEVAGSGVINGSGVDVEPNAGQSVANILFSQCKFVNNVACGLTWGIGLSNASTSNIFVDRNTATGNDYGLNAELTNGSAITGNTVSNNTSFGIYIHDQIYNTVCTGNSVSYTGTGGDRAGIELYNDTGTLVNGNTSTSNSSYGILSASSTNPTITNNVCTSNGVSGIRISGSTGTTQYGNTQ